MMMDSLDLPQDMLWLGKTEPLSPDHKAHASSSSSSSHYLAAAAGEQQLWPNEDDILLSCKESSTDLVLIGNC